MTKRILRPAKKPIPPPPGPPGGEMHAREMRLLAAGIDTTELQKGVADMVKQATPPGWKASSVTPPWAHTGGTCRSCLGMGASGPLNVVLLTESRPDQQMLLYTFAIVCQGCMNQPEKMADLKGRAFRHQQNPGAA